MRTPRPITEEQRSVIRAYHKKKISPADAIKRLSLKGHHQLYQLFHHVLMGK